VNTSGYIEYSLLQILKFRSLNLNLERWKQVAADIGHIYSGRILPKIHSFEQKVVFLRLTKN